MTDPETETGPSRGSRLLSDRRLGITFELGLAIVAFLYFVNIEGYPVLLASLAGAAVAMLIFSGRRTLANLLDLQNHGYDIDREESTDSTDAMDDFEATEE